MADNAARASFRRPQNEPPSGKMSDAKVLPMSPPETRSTVHKAPERRVPEVTSPSRSLYHHQHRSQYQRGPRSLRLKRGNDGFGFTLRHFIVYPPDSYTVLAGEQRLGIQQTHSRPDDPMDTIFVKHVRDQSSAHIAGLRTGDRIVCVNGKVGLNYAQVVQLVQQSETYLHLLVVPKEDDLLQLYFGETAHNPYTNQRPWESQQSYSLPIEGMKAHSNSSLRLQQHPSLSPSPMLTYSNTAGHPEALTGRIVDTRSLTRQGSSRRLSEGSVTSGRPLNGHQAASLVSSAESVRSAVAAAASRRINEDRRRESSGSLTSDSPRLSVSSDVEADPSVIHRIKKSFEQKEEFLKRPNQPICLPNAQVREFYAVPSKFEKPQWPPQQANGERQPEETPTSPSISATASARAQFMYGGPVTNFSATSSPIKQQNTSPRTFVTTLSKITENLAISSLSSSEPVSPIAKTDSGSGLISPLSQMVSKRARQFESGQVEEDKTVLYRSELARLTAKKVVPDVAHRKQEFESLSKESKSLDTAPRSPPPRIVPVVSVSPPPLPTPPASPTPSPSPTTTPTETKKPTIRTRDLPIFGSLSGNRLIPVGGRYIPCDDIPGWLEDDESGGDDDIKESNTSAEVHPMPRSRSNSIESWPRAPTSWDTRRSSTRRNNNEATPAVVGGVQMRKPRQHSLEVEAERAVRRESYLKATWSERMDSSDVSDNDTAVKPAESPAGSPSDEKSIAKIQDLFGKQADKILREGWLHCKVSLQEGKRATDRSWKQVWAVLRTNALHLRKERRDNTNQGASSEEHVVPLQGCTVDAAADYTKRKNVLRVDTSSGSQLLFQAEDPQDMAKWLHLLRPQSLESFKDDSSSETPPTSPPYNTGNNSPPQGPRVSPVAAHKGIRKLTTSFRNRSPTGQSPVNKTRKPCQNEPLASPKTKTWKGRVAKQLRKMQGNSPNSPTTPHPEGCTIGIPLEFCPQSNFSEFVPWLVVQCTRIVEERGLEVIGIYRVPGNTAAVTSLTDAANRGSDANNLQDPRWNDVNVISSLLKSFFRKLPDSLFTSELYPSFVLADKFDDVRKRFREIRRLVHELPDHNYETLRFLMAHLTKVVEHSNTNKMEAKNLAIVFGPTLLRASDDNMVAMVTDMPHQCRIVESLISHADWFFSDEDDPDDPVSISIPSSLPESDSAADAANHALLLNNIHKVEGLKAESPSKELSAKEIVSSIISAANKKMQKAKSKRGMRLNSEDSTDVRDADDKTADKGSKSEGEPSETPSIAASILSSVLFSGNIVKSIHTANPEQVSQQEHAHQPPPEPQTPVTPKLMDGCLIHTYTGLSANTQERVRRFEQETKAALSRDYSKHFLEDRRGSLTGETDDFCASPIEIRKKQPDSNRDASSSNRHSLPLSAKPPSGSPRMSAAGSQQQDSRTALAVLNTLRNIRRGNSVENLSASSLHDKASVDSQKSNGSLKRLKTENEMALTAPSPFVMRCGSLDSLHESCSVDGGKPFESNANRPFSETSDDGHDLLESLTSTFDKKMKDLMSHPDKQADESPAESSPADESKSEEKQTSNAAIEFRPYRDPSLHRSKTKSQDLNTGSPQDSPNKSCKSREKENRSRKRDSGSGLSKLEKEVRNNCQVLAPSNAFLARMKRKSGAYTHRGIKRRHTVGGTKDLAKIGWPADEGISAAGPVLTEAQQQAALRSWLQRGRLRSSSPELSPRTAAVVLLLAAELAALKKHSKKSSPDILAGLTIPLESHV
ncbi:rho GTPase-activating protein 23 isoform X4 [Cloeon dipterum]|uniref:rho GTPase-activating protein 23 isoform X4 n=1 Tax=Cloeon dipterum TaxID=197152 RepID=UPI003220292C